MKPSPLSPKIGNLPYSRLCQSEQCSSSFARLLHRPCWALPSKLRRWICQIPSATRWRTQQSGGARNSRPVKWFLSGGTAFVAWRLCSWVPPWPRPVLHRLQIPATQSDLSHVSMLRKPGSSAVPGLQCPKPCSDLCQSGLHGQILVSKLHHRSLWISPLLGDTVWSSAFTMIVFSREQDILTYSIGSDVPWSGEKSSETQAGRLLRPRTLNPSPPRSSRFPQPVRAIGVEDYNVSVLACNEVGCSQGTCPCVSAGHNMKGLGI